MRKTRKSKIVILSILGLAAVSIGSIGFATWLVGINKTEETLHVEAKVDSSVNDSQYIEISVKRKDFNIAETSEVARDDSHIVGAKTTGTALGVKADALTFEIDTFTVLVGKGVTEKPTKVVLELTADENTFNTVSASADLIKDCQYTQGSGETATPKTIGARTEAPLTYGRPTTPLAIKTLSKTTSEPASASNFSTYTFEPTSTLTCFPPVSIIAYI